MNQIRRIENISFIHNLEPTSNYGMSNQAYCFKNGDNITRTLIKFDSEYLNGLRSEYVNSGIGYLINLKMFISVNRPIDSNFTIRAYPLTKDWEEGLGSTHKSSDGVDWLQTGMENWTTAGGDYDVNDPYSVTINEKHQYIEIDLDKYLDRVTGTTPQPDYGIILVSGTKQSDGTIVNEGETNAYKFSMYSDDSPSGYDPIIQILDDDYVNVFENTSIYSGTTYTDSNGNEVKTGDRIIDGQGDLVEKSDDIDVLEFDTDDFPIIIDAYNYKFIHEKGEFFMSQINIQPRYSRNSLFYPKSTLKYLKGIKYKLVDESRGKIIYDYSEYTRISIREKGLLLTVSTQYLNRGNYFIVMQYEDSDGSKYFSNRVYFTIN